MKLSSGTIGTLLFTAVAVTAFVFMAKRPAVEGSAMNFGMPLQTATSVEKAIEEKTPEAPVATETTTATTTEEATMPETTSMPSSTVATPEVKTEEMPTDVPAAN